jgi:hypothetical protein
MIIVLTYKDSWPDCFGAGGWRIRDTDGCFRTFPSRAALGTASPTAVPVHDILDHWVCGFGWRAYSDEAKATVMHGLRNGIGIRRSLEMLAEDFVADPQPPERIDFFLSPRRSGRPAEDAARGHRDAVTQAIRTMGRRNAVAAIARGLHRIGLGGVTEAQIRWDEAGLDFSLMGYLGHALQRLLEEAEREVATETIEPIDTTVEVLPGLCRLSAVRTGFRGCQRY